jgi:deoxycytidylate deaminase
MDSDFSSLLKSDPNKWWIDRMYLQDTMKYVRKSTDPNTQVGASLVVDDGTGIIFGRCNAVAERLVQAGYPIIKEDKNFCTEHAERNLIFDAIQNGVNVDGMTMYCNWATCAECSRCIIKFGIKRVVTFSAVVERTPEKWKKSVWEGLSMLKNCGISVVGWRGDFGIQTSFRFDGKWITNKDLL